MRGTLREKRPGYWELRVDGPPDPVTKRRRQISRGFRGTRKAAERALRELASEVDQGKHRATGQTVAFLLEQWYAHSSPSWSPTTRAVYRQVIDSDILPALGGIPLSKLRPSDLDRLYDRLLRQGQAPATVRKRHNILRRALAQAEKWDWIDRNPATRASPPAVHQPEIVSPAAGAVQTVIAAAEARSPDFACMTRVAAATGARRGELCGLRWSDVDLEGGSVRIRRAVIQVGKHTEVKDTKTHAGRVVAIDPATTAALSSQRARLEERARAGGVELVADPYVFPRRGRWPCLDGSQWSEPARVTDEWRRLVASLGSEAGRLHGLRHFAATELLGASVPLPTVSKRLGHRRTSTTADIYAAFIPASDQEAATVMGSRLAAPGD